MSYDAFLMILSQLAGQKKARVVIDGHPIFIETQTNKKKWSLSTKVFSGEGYLPKKVRECVSSSGLLRWQERGAYLKLDAFSHSVYLIQEIQSSGKYVPFKYFMHDFMHVAKEWREILNGFADQDQVFVRS